MRRNPATFRLLLLTFNILQECLFFVGVGAVPKRVVQASLEVPHPEELGAGFVRPFRLLTRRITISYEIRGLLPTRHRDFGSSMCIFRCLISWRLQAFVA